MLKQKGALPLKEKIDLINIYEKEKKNERNDGVHCKDCNKCYIGQTKQYLKKRIYNHQYTVTHNVTAETALSKHSKDRRHNFDFQNTKILKKENNYKKRLIYEMIYIKKDENAVVESVILPKMGLYSEKSKVRLDGKTAIITGCNTGIGKETAMDLYKRGATVIMACRNTEKAEEAANDIINSTKEIQNHGKIIVVELNLSSLASVRECSDKILQKHERIDLLINNAGVMTCPYGKTEDGFETQIGTNHLGHFLFTLLLLPRIIQSTPARIVNVSSMAHRGIVVIKTFIIFEFHLNLLVCKKSDPVLSQTSLTGYIDFDDLNWDKRSYSAAGAYQQSKLANILFTKELNRRLKEANIEGVTVYTLHPGAINTDLQRHIGATYGKTISWMINSAGKCFFKTPLEGAQTTIYCAIDEKAGKESGLYYSECKPTRPSDKAEDMTTAKRLWDVSYDLVKLQDYDPFKN
ncbi:phosphatidylinositol-glycan biosynthesis class f protein-related [Holotrichia oblita]|uniref:Phosphatidylinositol-glycan biosynthesis class f protein-related n=1 Tax=Holotrichia oblita TaxID=644536 RepID=A0ACB9TEP7_HOLOL|nr:phosphatidylinositol-glycan biosynthesis class f protein-related [Holotrichia oblita]